MVLLLILAAIGVLILPKERQLVFAALVLSTIGFRVFFYSYSDTDGYIFAGLIAVTVGVFIHGIIARIATLIR